jgi:ribose transport system permease protein
MENDKTTKLNQSNPTLQRLNKLQVFQFIRQNSSMLIALVALCILFTLLSPHFFKAANAVNILRQISMNAIIAFGMTFVLLTGGIDLSVGSIVAATNCMSVLLMVQGVPLSIAILAGMLTGAGIGFINGIVTAKGKIPPFITTLAMMTIARGFAYVCTGGKPVRFDDASFAYIGNGYIGIFPVPVIAMLICLGISAYVLNRTKFGKHLYATGGNEVAAIFSGIKTNRIKIIVYTICGLFTGISGVILGARMSSAQPIAGQGAELDAIAAVVIGGTSLSGGSGRIGGTIIGALFIGVLSNGMNIIQVPSYWQLIVKGLVILAAVFIDSYRKSKKD